MNEPVEAYEGTIMEGVIRTSPPKKELSILEQFFANLVKDETARQISTLKEEVSDLIGTQLDALKAGEVADAVKAAVADAKRVANMDTIKQIRTIFQISKPMQNLINLPQEITATREEIAEKTKTLRTVRQSLNDAEFAMKEAETNLLADIAAEVIQGTDKPKFSNDKARQAELATRKKTDPDYLAAVEAHKNIKAQYEGVEDEISDLTIKKKKLKAQFEAECRTLEAMTAEMNIYAAALGAGASAGAYSGAVYGTVGLAETVLEPVRECWCAKVSPAKPEQVGQINQENKNSEPKGW